MRLLLVEMEVCEERGGAREESIPGWSVPAVPAVPAAQHLMKLHPANSSPTIAEASTSCTEHFEASVE
jgi:hypothetical protein